MAEALSPADRSSLAAEQGAVNMTVAGVLTFDRHPAITREAIAARVAERIHLVPRLRQRIAEPAMGLANPVWVDDDHFDIDLHLRSTVLPAPGGPEELGALVGRELSGRLDRTRPLWDMLVIDGLQGDRTALLFRVHHALVDGVAAIALAVVALDVTPEPASVPPAEGWDPRPYAVRRHLATLARGPFTQAQRMLFDATGRMLDPQPLRAAGELRRATELLAELARNRPQAPPTPLNDPLGRTRRFALAEAPLGDIKRAAKAAGGTVNDVILAAVAGMLRLYLDDARGREPVALVPVNVRRAGEEGGNRISTVLVDLPAEITDPVQRIRVVGERTRALKDSAAVRAGTLMVGAAGLAPPLVSSMLARALSGVRAFNIVVSNLPGPQQPLYLNGAEVRSIHPVVPLNPANQRLSLGVLSYNGGVYFGLLGDRALQPAVAEAQHALQVALDELVG
ncbi:MAG TPA: wax ester/triacylglycerol synthase family O-acyltransferase [Solirubrobacteraceae bacterium]|jgi:WS/DGAT/MGAT family acyltransferase|nr:wax ester/triacylglycerol synthase family O-acyltransferase [Solirubrobacteraceae bacterium]